MLKTIRRKFIFTSMAAIGIALAILYVLVSVGTNLVINNYNDKILDVLIENNGEFNQNFDPSDKRFDLTQETPFETRYFTVEYLSDGSTIIHTEQIRTVTSNEAKEYADEAIEKNNKKGYSGSFRYKISETDVSTLVVFVDTSRQEAISSATNLISIGTCVVIFILFCIFIVLFSKKFTKPIADNLVKQKSFITNAAHELKTPLTVISANNELIEMEYGENESTQSINKQVSKMNKMVKNLTSLAALDEKMGIDIKTTCKLSDIVIETVESFKENFEINNIKLTANIEGNLEIQGDEKLLKQLFYIMIENANKYAKTFVDVSLCNDKGKMYFEIKNDADGIDNGNLDKCFERFYRSDVARASGKDGSGIGLSIAKEIVELHKGIIHAIGDNNVFTIKIGF